MPAPNLTEIHNSAFAPLDRQLAQQGATAKSTLGDLAGMELTQQKTAARQQGEMQDADRTAYSKAMSQINSMPPDLQEQVLAQAMQSPKFVELHKTYGGGIPARPNDFTTEERATRARDTRIQDLLTEDQTAKIRREEVARIKAEDAVNGNPDLANMKRQAAIADAKTREMASFAAATDPEIAKAREDAAVATRLGDGQAAVKFSQILANSQTVKDGEIALQAEKVGGLQRVRAEDSEGNLHDVTRAEASANRWKIHGAVYVDDVEKLSSAKNPLISHMQKMQKVTGALQGVLDQPNVEPDQKALLYLKEKDRVMPQVWNSFAVGIAALDRKIGTEPGTMSRVDAVKSRISQMDEYLTNESFRISEQGKKLYRNLKAEYEKADLRNPLFLIIEDVKPMKYPDDPTDPDAPRLTRNAKRKDATGTTPLDIARDMFKRCGLEDADTFLDSLYVSKTTQGDE